MNMKLRARIDGKVKANKDVKSTTVSAISKLKRKESGLGPTKSPDRKKRQIINVSKATSSSAKTQSRKLNTDRGSKSKKDSSSGMRAKHDDDHSSSIFSIPQEFIDTIEDENMREDIQKLHSLITHYASSLEISLDFLKKNTLGYGKYHYKYKSGREGDWYRLGISCSNSSSKTKSISLHCCGVVNGKYVLEDFSSKKSLGKTISIGKSCVRFKRLSDLKHDVLVQLLQATATSDLMT